MKFLALFLISGCLMFSGCNVHEYHKQAYQADAHEDVFEIDGNTFYFYVTSTSVRTKTKSNQVAPFGLRIKFKALRTENESMRITKLTLTGSLRQKDRTRF